MKDVLHVLLSLMQTSKTFERPRELISAKPENEDLGFTPA